MTFKAESILDSRIQATSSIVWLHGHFHLPFVKSAKMRYRKLNSLAKTRVSKQNCKPSKRSEEKMARLNMASAGTTLAGKKRIASTKEPRGAE